MTGEKRTPFLTDIKTPSGDRDPWKPLYCEHKGDGRVAWTPLVMHSSRSNSMSDSTPRQKILWRFPTIRSCCIPDSFTRAAWWHDVERSMAGWHEVDLGLVTECLVRDKPAMLRKLREVAPRPTATGQMKFSALKERTEREAKEWLDAWFAEQRAERLRQEHEEEQRLWEQHRRDEADRKQRESDRRARSAGGPKTQNDNFGSYHSYQGRGPTIDEMNGQRQREAQEQARYWEEQRRQAAANEQAARDWSARNGSYDARGFADDFERRIWEAINRLRGGSDLECFAVLGLKPDATTDRVKAAYRELSKKHHPDMGGKQEDFIRINAAYELCCKILSGRAAS